MEKHAGLIFETPKVKFDWNGSFRFFHLAWKIDSNFSVLLFVVLFLFKLQTAHNLRETRLTWYFRSCIKFHKKLKTDESKNLIQKKLFQFFLVPCLRHLYRNSRPLDVKPTINIQRRFTCSRIRIRRARFWKRPWVCSKTRRWIDSRWTNCSWNIS